VGMGEKILTVWLSRLCSRGLEVEMAPAMECVAMHEMEKGHGMDASLEDRPR